MTERETDMQRFAECGSCGAYHRADYWGDCRNDDERFEYPADDPRLMLQEEGMGGNQMEGENG